MVRRPDASDTLVQTRDRLLGPLQLLAAGLLEQVRLLQDLLLLQIPDADGLLTAIDVVTLDDWVLVRSRRDADLDLGVLLCEGGERVLEEGAVEWNIRIGTQLGPPEFMETYIMPRELPAQSQ